MSTVFLSNGIWPQLSVAACGSRRRCAVAVACFGGGAGRLLPLAQRSRLIVDASEQRGMNIQTTDSPFPATMQ